MQKKVFLSYSSHDAAAAMEVCRALESMGIACWIAPRDIPGGADYGDIIDKAIIGCGAFVLIFSSHSNASQWVRGEVNLAFTENKPIVPYRLDDAPLTGAMRLILNQMHWLDAHSDSNCKELATTIKRILNITDTADSTENTTPPTPNRSGAPKRRKGVRSILWILAILIVVGLLGGGYWLSQRGKGVKSEEKSVEVDSVALAQAKSDSLARAEAARAEAALAEERRRKREAAERAEEERIRKAKQAEERAARERDSLQRVLRERERVAAERERIQRELDSLERVRAEQELIAKQTAERLERERAEREAAEKAERERQERLAREKQEQERLAREKQEQERLARKKAEREATEKAAREAAEKAAREAAEREKVAQAARKIYKVGDFYRDNEGREGIVFRVDSTGEHGTIISLDEPATKMEWVVLKDDDVLVAIGASNRSNGASNQRQAMMQPRYAYHYPAFVWCMTRQGGGWYLPAIEELELLANDSKLLRTVNAAIKANGGKPLSNNGYWSSSEVSVRKAHSIYISDNTGNYSSEEGKWVRNYVRAVYRF